jgi:hypothetical protein
MKLKELQKLYTDHDLCYSTGDRELRHKIFSPFFRDRGKVIYYEKFICVAELKNLNMTPDLFEATVAPCLAIERVDLPSDMRIHIPVPSKPWRAYCRWEYMTLNGNDFSAHYCGWRIWPEAEQVQRIEQLAREGQFAEAIRLTLRGEDD